MEPLDRLPETYATALRLKRQGLDDAQIGIELALPPQSIGPLLALAEAKLAGLTQPQEERG